MGVSKCAGRGGAVSKGLREICGHVKRGDEMLGIIRGEGAGGYG